MEAEYDISGNKQNKSEAGSNVHLRKYVTLAETASEPKNLIDIIRQVILKFIHSIHCSKFSDFYRL